MNGGLEVLFHEEDGRLQKLWNVARVLPYGDERKNRRRHDLDVVSGESLGDLLVNVSSAADTRSQRTGAAIALEVFHRLNHFDLLYDEAVYVRIRDWLVARQNS